MTFQLTLDGPEVYERVLVPLWFGRWAEALIDLVTPVTGESILDIACGTGVTTRLAQQAVGPTGRVVGLDINAGMLATARRLAAEAPIEWIESDVVDLPFDAGSFHAAIAQHGYHYFPNKPAALAEFRRVLKPGGRIALSIWTGHSPYTSALCDALAQHISADVASIQSAQRECPSAEDLAQALITAGFTDVEVIRQTLTISVPLAEEFVPLHLASMPIAAAFEALPDQSGDALIRDVGAALEQFRSGDRLVYPDSVHVMTGRA